MTIKRFAAATFGTLLLLSGSGVAGATEPGRVGTWAAAPSATPESNTPTVADATVRQVVHTSIGGGDLRIRLTNEFGRTPLRIGAVHVARRAGTGTDIDPATDRAVRFSGSESATAPPGAPLVSDPVPLSIDARDDLVVSIHLPGPTPITSLHDSALQENAVADGNVVAAPSVVPVARPTSWYLLSGVSVRPTGRAASVVAFGDSITDGASTQVNANHRWPDLLAERLRRTGVLNAGIGGNRLLHDPNPPAGNEAEEYAAFFGEAGLRRFDRDVLAQPGVRDVIVLLGVNDLGHPGTIAPPSETVTAQQLIDGHRQLIARAHAAGIRIHGGTILPFKGDGLGFYTPENEAKRQAVNDWIRTGGEYDSVVDFDAATRDPADPQRLRPEFDGGDGLHPNDAGAVAMAAAVPARVLE
ncbi:SGNH/GDSL hydrolase family protein [Saccharopolyspora sp. ID03-671]|uniref:SGNH/GDSL hydrolase family protein n=1 Tax=Saccharopolyspora sp. ID03-671 TaxID=3073066 RepID=UPI003253EB54